MKLNKGTFLKLSSGIGVSIICLYFALKGIDFAALLTILKTTKIVYVILFLLILVVTVFLRALIYYRFLKREKKVSLFSIFEGLMIGYMVNSLFPLRAGDIAKAYVIGKLNHVSKTYTFTLAIIERLFDLINLFIAMVILLCITELDYRYESAVKILAAIIAAALLFIIFNLRYGDRVSRIVDLAGFFLQERIREKIKGKLRIVQEGFKIFCSPGDILYIQGIVFLIWVGYVAVSYITGLSIGISLNLSTIIMLIVTISMGNAIAASPGGLGIHQYACVLVFSLTNLSREKALGFSLIQNTLTVITPIIIGWIFLLHTNLSLTSISTQARQKEDGSN